MSFQQFNNVSDQIEFEKLREQRKELLSKCVDAKATAAVKKRLNAVSKRLFQLTGNPIYIFH